MERRKFIKISGAGLSSLLMLPVVSCYYHRNIPGYLKEYSDLYSVNPFGTASKWFKDAKFGLFLHYGVYSLLGRGEWVQFREKIPVLEYEKLKYRFTAENFDANLLLNTAPLPDGSIDKQDIKSLKEAGARIRKYGWPVASI